MGRTASAYERELREILRGQAEALRKYGRRLPPVDRQVLGTHGKRPFLVVRAAGSLGFDLVALRPEFAFPIEVKSSHETTIRFSSASGRADEQLEAHRAAVARVGLLAVYAYRRVGGSDDDCWRLFSASPLDGHRGTLALLRKDLPEVERTAAGAGVLRWQNGLPLLAFLRRVSFLTERTAGPGGS